MRTVTVSYTHLDVYKRQDVDDHDASYVTGRMTNNILVHFPGSKDLIGTLINVRLTECRGFYYMGEQENA